MTRRIAMLRGDGIGDELLDEAQRVFAVVAPEFELQEARAGFQAFRDGGQALPPAALELARNADAALLIAVGSPLGPAQGYASPIIELRQELDLYANLRPVRSPVDEGVDLVIVRENTEGLYARRERVTPEGAIAERVVTRAATERIVRLAAELSERRRGRLAIVHKANVLRTTCGLFRAIALEVLRAFPHLEVEEMLVDHAAYRLAADPERFDVLVTTNLFGDILSDVAAHAGGGMGLVSSANVGERHALFEPVHGSAPDIAGRGIANPVATIRAVAALLAHLGAEGAARRLERCIAAVLEEGPRTPDVGGRASSSEVTSAVLEAWRQGAPGQPGSGEPARAKSSAASR